MSEYTDQKIGCPSPVFSQTLDSQTVESLSSEWVTSSKISCPSSVDSKSLDSQTVDSQSSEWVPRSKIGCPSPVDSQTLDSQTVDSQSRDIFNPVVLDPLPSGCNFIYCWPFLMLRFYIYEVFLVCWATPCAMFSFFGLQ